MTFNEAVQALKDGLCEGFRRDGWQRGTFLEFDDTASTQLVFNCGAPYIPYACDFFADDYKFVNPKPQMETAEVKLWAKINNETGHMLCYGEYDNIPQTADHEHYSIVELTGAYQREIKPKVKRREELPSTCVSITRTDLPTNGSYKFFAEWEE